MKTGALAVKHEVFSLSNMENTCPLQPPLYIMLSCVWVSVEVVFLVLVVGNKTYIYIGEVEYLQFV